MSPQRAEEAVCNQGFQLAYFVWPQRVLAIVVLSKALARFDTLVCRQDKRFSYIPKTQRTKVTMGAPLLLQWLILDELEQLERRQEDTESLGSLSPRDLLIRFIKYLAKLTLGHNSFHVIVGIGQVLHSYTSGESSRFYEGILKGQTIDHSQYRRTKSDLIDTLLTRFRRFVRTTSGSNHSLNFESQPASDVDRSLVLKCLRLFTPWGTQHLPTTLDPERGMPFFEPDSDDVDAMHPIEQNRMHAIICPACFPRATASLGLQPPDGKLNLPLFTVPAQHDPPSVVGPDPPSLSEDETLAILGSRELKTERRRGFSGVSLSVQVNGMECATIDLRKTATVEVECHEPALIIEVFGHSADGPTLLATHLPMLEKSKDGLWAASVLLERGHEITIAPSRKGPDAFEVCYREMRPSRALSRLTDRAKNKLLRKAEQAEECSACVGGSALASCADDPAQWWLSREDHNDPACLTSYELETIGALRKRQNDQRRNFAGGDLSIYVDGAIVAHLSAGSHNKLRLTIPRHSSVLEVRGLGAEDEVLLATVFLSHRTEPLNSSQTSVTKLRRFSYLTTRVSPTRQNKDDYVVDISYRSRAFLPATHFARRWRCWIELRPMVEATGLILCLCSVIWFGHLILLDEPRSLSEEYSATIDLLHSDQTRLALYEAESGLSRAKQKKDLTVEWQFRLLKAEILLAQRKPSAALAVLDEDPLDKAEWTESSGKTLLLRASAASIMDRYAEAEDLLNRAAEQAHQSGSNGLSTEIELRRALLLVKQVRFHEAEDSLRRVIKEASALRESYLEATATGNLGYTLLTAARFDEAIIWLERARTLHTQLHANESVARDNANLGTCYYRLGDYDKARLYYEHAQTGFAMAGNHFEEQIWTGNDGNVLEDTGRYTEAKAAFRRAFEVARLMRNDEWASRWLTDLANNAIQLQDWDAAEQYNSMALALRRRLGNTLFEASSLLNAGRIALGRGQLAKAQRLFRSAMTGPAEDPSVALEAHTGLADVFVQSHRSARADAEFKIAVSAIERLSSSLIKDDYRFAYLASLIRFYRKYVDFLVANHQSRRALEVAESSRSHVLAQRSGRPTPSPSHAAKAYQKLALQAHAVLLEYWLGENQSYLWVITPQRIRNYALPPEKTIQGLVETYRNVVLGQRNPLDAAGDVGRKLYDTLLAPAAKDLCAGCRVILVPDQDLYALNFESLPAGSDADRFWIEQANVEIAPSLDYLVDTSRRPHVHGGKGLLVMGDPAPVLPEYPRLEFASREIDSIRSTMGGSESQVLRGPEARPDSYTGTQPGRFEFIHFSAHAAANTQSPLDSAVILSGPADRCKLFARDVMSVPLTAELVTISACRSAGAKTYAGEGPVGFAWAFLRAGARNVIAGLWDVNDRSTAQLMSGLYAEIARGSTPADALRAAKLSLVRGGGSYAKPYYWAPFQVYTGTIN